MDGLLWFGMFAVRMEDEVMEGEGMGRRLVRLLVGGLAICESGTGAQHFAFCILHCFCLDFTVLLGPGCQASGSRGGGVCVCGVARSACVESVAPVP